MKVDLGGQVAVVTGGAKGIGRAIVRAFADNGANTVIVDIDGEAGQRAADEVARTSAPCVAVPGDVASIDQMETMAQQTLDRLRRVDILRRDTAINASRHPLPIHEYSLDDS